MVCDGSRQPCEVLTSAGWWRSSQPGVNDRRVDAQTANVGVPPRRSSPRARETPKIAEVLPLLYLRGLSSGLRARGRAVPRILHRAVRAGRSSPSPSATASSDSGRALCEVFPTTRDRRCWFHKIAYVLGVLPKSAYPARRGPWPSPERRGPPPRPRRGPSLKISSTGLDYCSESSAQCQCALVRFTARRPIAAS